MKALSMFIAATSMALPLLISGAHADELGLDNLHDIDAYPTQPHPLLGKEKSDADKGMETCLQMNSLAETIMKSRQEGVPMAALINAIKKVDTGIPEVDSVAIAMITEAYQVPKFGSPKYQREAVVEFSSDALSMCIEKFVL